MPDRDEPWTILRLLNWTQSYLRDKGSESPRLDAEVLLSHVLQTDRVKLYTQYAQEVGSTDRASYRELIRKRAEGSPVAYLVGRKEFFSLPLSVSPGVLIPRPDTEFAVVECLDVLKGRAEPLVVDVGTGSGAIALAVAHQRIDARLVAIDLSPDALAVARSNAERHRLSDRVEFVEGDLLAPVADRGPFDVIISNPPYIPTGVIPTLDAGVREFEPHLALDGGEDGLRVVSRLIEQAAPLLKPGGHLILEIGSDQEQPVRDLLGSFPELEPAPTVRDGAGHPRVIRARRRDG
ncbi:peptide chain release factor N(5)-glutamine methyltransferase [Tautonia plasticadhaerens]|uniref:Release factor glutamine methyltransferase n=1 Tax=Tautonia plasticadhaerens TaxID=2527974 RepID=A0A518GXD0_9BACT|nr:peptide chain release factor N(5)-glutamine methyltransferase [Tautonia plasticadhaerens]QDV33222.1 Release factor glutamine methyltransferase [Tautonia plasticadhaerens]